jgi:nucleoside-diphosphate-sugar epimerase
MTWAVNSYLPGAICKKFKNSRIAVFSSGNVYGLSAVTKGGSVENDVLNPKGEYAMSVLGRERVFEYFSREFGIPVSIIRLNYACELRYGILVDIARTVAAGKSVDISMSYFNVIWQRDANIASLLSLGHASSPAFVFNLTGKELLSTRNIALKFGELFGTKVEFVGDETSDALLSNAQLGYKLFGYPQMPVDELIEQIANWIKNNGYYLDKKTHFETRDGNY